MKTIYKNRILILGILLLCLAISRIATIFTYKSSLTPLKGELYSADTYYSTVTDGKDRKSVKSELIFYLIGYKQKFQLIENIDQKYNNKEFESILKGLNRTKYITVWIRKDDISEYEPTVYQIDTDDRTLLEFEHVKQEEHFLTGLLFFFSFIYIIFYLSSTFPEKSYRLIKWMIR